MAQCTKCKKTVGCGCQLVGGVCDTCRKAEAEAKLKQQSKIKQDQEQVPQQKRIESNPYDTIVSREIVTPPNIPIAAIFGSVI